MEDINLSMKAYLEGSFPTKAKFEIEVFRIGELTVSPPGPSDVKAMCQFLASSSSDFFEGM